MSTSSEGLPGRYERSFGGLVAALVVTVVVVGGLLWFLGLFRAETEIDPQAVDYLAIAGEAQDAGLEPVYPVSLPAGWTATAYDVMGGEDPTFEIRMLTGDDEFVAIHQSSTPAPELLREYVDEETSPIDIYSTPGSVARAWEGFEDEGGDTAYAAEVGGQTVLVYGAVPAEDLQDLVDLLTTAPVAAD